MNKLLFFAALLFPASIFAQNVKDTSWAEKPLHHQVNINATMFIKQFVTLNSTPVTIQQFANPFSVGYKLFLSTGNGKMLTGIRTGLGFMETYQNGPPDNFNPNFESKIKETALAGRIGLEVQQRITKHWLFYYGADYVYQNNNRDATTKFTNFNGQVTTTTSKENINSSGGGPVLGVQFNINNRISLSTETAFYYLENRSKSTTTTENPNGPPALPKDKNGYSRELGFIAPAFINFNIMF